MAKHVEAINVSSSAAVSRPSFNATQDCAGGCGGTYAGIVCDNECYGDASILSCNVHCDNYSSVEICGDICLAIMSGPCDSSCDLASGLGCTSTCLFYSNMEG